MADTYQCTCQPHRRNIRHPRAARDVAVWGSSRPHLRLALLLVPHLQGQLRQLVLGASASLGPPLRLQGTLLRLVLRLQACCALRIRSRLGSNM
jgi:hypothetical protein